MDIVNDFREATMALAMAEIKLRQAQEVYQQAKANATSLQQALTERLQGTVGVPESPTASPQPDKPRTAAAARRVAIMRFLHAQGPATSRTVADAVRDKIEQTYHDLRDLAAWGLVEKHDGQDREKLWSVTDKGITKYQELARDLKV